MSQRPLLTILLRFTRKIYLLSNMFLIHKPRPQKQKQKPTIKVGLCFWWEWLDCNSHIRLRSMGPFRLRLEPVVLISATHNQKQKPTIKVGLCFWWEWLDSNQLRLKPTDLQSAPALQLRRTPNPWCGQRESNPHFKLGRLAY